MYQKYEQDENMLLSDLRTGESAVVIKVLGHGGFRRRILEMGFVRGQRVVSVLNAPLRDPIKYGIMGYEVSLRRSEAAMVGCLQSRRLEPFCQQRMDSRLRPTMRIFNML